MENAELTVHHIQPEISTTIILVLKKKTQSDRILAKINGKIVERPQHMPMRVSVGII
jgi:hypothetical protein